MYLVELFPIMENKTSKPANHTDMANPDTGFYGHWGAGCIIVATATGRFLVGHRSNNPPPFHVEQPGEWGTFGGKADYGDSDPQAVAVRELTEETGYQGALQLKKLYVFKTNGFRYHNFLGIVPEEFKPLLNWENQAARWVNFGAWPRPLHFGLNSLLADPASFRLMQQYANEETTE